jgi:hypothetical protein
MVVLSDSGHRFMLSLHSFDLVFKVLNSEVEIQVVLVLVFFNFEHFSLHGNVVLRALLVKLIDMFLFSLSLMRSQRLNSVLKIADLICLTLM